MWKFSFVSRLVCGIVLLQSVPLFPRLTHIYLSFIFPHISPARITTLPVSPPDDDPFTLSGVFIPLIPTVEQFQEQILDVPDMVCVITYVPGVRIVAEMVQVYAALAHFFSKRNVKFYRCYVLAALHPSVKTMQVPSLKVYAEGAYQKEYQGRVSFRTLKRALEQDQTSFAT